MNRGKTVLIIEDDQAIGESLELLFSSRGFDVLHAENGDDALTILRHRAALPSLLLLDIVMPVMDGWAFRSHQTQDPRLAPIPVIVMTASGNAAQKAASMAAQGWIEKPIDVARLMNQVDALVA